MIELLLQAERALAVGLLDQAEQLYRQAIERDPRNGIAVVGLARVALERGAERTAYELACEALAIDPENAAAQRLGARLVEVMAYRGETPPEVTAVGVVAETPDAAAAGVLPAPPPVRPRNPQDRRPARRGLLGRLLRRS